MNNNDFFKGAPKPPKDTVAEDSQLELSSETQDKDDVNSEENAEKQTSKLGRFLCLFGLVVSMFSLFISLLGVIPLIAVIISCMGYVKAGSHDKKSRLLAAIGVAIGLFGMVFAFVQMVFMV